MPGVGHNHWCGSTALRSYAKDIANPSGVTQATLTRNSLPNTNIAAAGDVKASSGAPGRVVVAGGVGPERTKTDSGIEVALGVVLECIRADGCVKERSP